MMTRLYIVIAALICFWFAYAWYTGARIIDLDGTGHSKPTGPGQHHK